MDERRVLHWTISVNGLISRQHGAVMYQYADRAEAAKANRQQFGGKGKIVPIYAQARK